MGEYEAMRDSVGGEFGAEWRYADKLAASYRQAASSIEADGHLSEEGKSERIQGEYAKVAEKVSRARSKARELAAKESKASYERSIPLPEGSTLRTGAVKDSSELLAVQNEAQDILAKAERRRAKLLPNMRGTNVELDVLREEYAAGMDGSGVVAKARCLGVLRAAEQLGIATEDVVGPFRGQKHYEAADESRRFSVLAASIPGDLQAPTALAAMSPRAPKGEFHTGNRGSKAFLSRSATTDNGGKRKRPSWK